MKFAPAELLVQAVAKSAKAKSSKSLAHFLYCISTLLTDAAYRSRKDAFLTTCIISKVLAFFRTILCEIAEDKTWLRNGVGHRQYKRCRSAPSEVTFDPERIDDMVKGEAALNPL